MFATRLSPTLSPSLYALNFKSAFALSFSCKSPPQWISSHLLNQGLLSLLGPSFASEIGPVTYSQTMNKQVSTQMFAARQARNEETWWCATVSGRDLALLPGNCADTFEKNIGRSRFDRPLAILARSPRDKFIILASRGINSIGNKTLCVEAKNFLRYCAYSLNRPIQEMELYET